MSDEESESTWQDKHPVLGLVVGTLTDIEQQGKTIRKLAAAVETLDQRVSAIENQLAKRKKRKGIQSKESNQEGDNDSSKG